MRKKMLVTMGVVLTFMLITIAGAHAGSFIGTYCFQWVNWTCDIWEWRVETVGDAYQLTGRDLCYMDAMDGGGTIDGTHMKLAVTEADADDGGRAIWAVDLDLATLSGTVDGSWLSSDHAIWSTWDDEPISNIPCPTAEDVARGKSNKNK